MFCRRLTKKERKNACLIANENDDNREAYDHVENEDVDEKNLNEITTCIGVHSRVWRSFRGPSTVFV